MSTAQQRADWSLKPRGTVSAAAQGALALAALGAAGHDVLHLHPGWAAAAATLGVIGTALTGGQHPPRALGYRLGCWLAAGGWLTWSWAATPWTQAALATLGLGTLAAGLLASWANTTPAPATPAHPAAGALVLRRHAKVADEWAARIRRCCNNLQVTIEDVEEWATKTGYTLTILLPLGGVTADRLRNAAEGLATDARLLKGCGIEVVDGDLRGTVLMHVATVNRLAADIDHPGDHSPRSVLNGITLGEYRNGDPMRLQVRQPRTIVVGTTGSAKTGTLHTITCELGLCTDNLVWHMDLNGGGVSQPWLRAWLDGQADRPAIDWAAGCPEEALLMAHAEVAIAKARKTAYSTRRMEADTDLLPVGEDVPQITTILDEGFEVLAPTVRDPLQAAIRGHLEETARIGRAEACQVLISALRSISTTISTDLLSLMHNRIIMAGCQQKEITFLYNQARGVGVADLAGPGSGFARLFGSHEIRPWKAWRMKPKRDIHPASLAISRLRPDLDTPSVAAAGQAYATRLERMRWLFSTAEQRTRLTPPEPIELPMTDTRGQPIIWDPAVTHPPAGDTSGREVAPAPAPAAPAASRATGRLALLHGGATVGWATPEQVTARTRPAAPAAPPGTHPYPSGPRPRLVAEQIHELTAAEAPVPELLVQALNLPWDNGRLHSEALAKALRMSEHELAALLGLLGVTTLPNAFERGGQRRRGYKRGDLEDAAEAIRSGDLPVPPEVADWSAA